MAFGLVAPPQADLRRVFELSRLQLQAFFYWLTFSNANNRGGFWPGVFFPINHALKSDWGNPIHQTFMTTVLNWRTDFWLPVLTDSSKSRYVGIPLLFVGHGPWNGTTSIESLVSLVNKLQPKMHLARYLNQKCTYSLTTATSGFASERKYIQTQKIECF